MVSCIICLEERLDLVCGTKAFFLTGLFGRLVVVELTCDMIGLRNYSRKQLIDVAQQRNEPIILQDSVDIVLKEQYHHLHPPVGTLEDYRIKYLLKDFQYRCYARFQKLCACVFFPSFPGAMLFLICLRAVWVS